MKKRIICYLAAGLMALSVAACGSKTETVVLPAQKEVTQDAIRDVFARHGMKVGTCVSGQVIGQSRTADLVLSQFNSVTMENAMKPDAILNREKSQTEGEVVVEYGQETLQVLAWAKEHGLSMRGHTLIWYSQTPEWLFRIGFSEDNGYVDREEMLHRMETMIRRNFEELERLGYLELFYAYDVVNEAWMEDGTLRQTHWSELIGDDYLWHAFYFADKYAPESIDLYYNDYNIQYKTEAVKEFVETTVDNDGRRLIDGVGLQGHLFTNDDLDRYFEAIDELSEAGIKLELTEVDAGLGSYQSALAPTAENLRMQGMFLYKLFQGIFERVDEGKLKMDAVTFWGFSDGFSWRSEYNPQLYDAYLNPKYALYGVMQIREHAGFETEEP